MSRLEKQKSQSGQAVVEYVLLLAIAVTLFLGLASQFYKPFGNWVQNQMGPYLECLLDVGELPSLGSDAGGECASEYRPFSPGAAIAGGTSGKNSRSGSGSDPESAKRTNGKSSSDGSGGSSSRSPGSNSNERGKGFSIGESRGADGAGNGNQNQTIVEKLPESQYLKLQSSGGTSIVVPQRSQATGTASRIGSENTKIKKRQDAPVNIGMVGDSDNSSKGKSILIKPSERKTASIEDDVPWSFGDYLKYAVILMIIVAIVLFLAGQVAQISKSMEK